MLLVGSGRLITQNYEMPYFEDGCVVIDRNIIKEVGNTETLRKKYNSAEFIDAKGKVIMPGMINTHMHIYSTFARGMALKDESPVKFLEILEKLWWRLDKALTLKDIKYSALVTFIDCIKNGTTTVFDHHASPKAVTDSLFTIGDVSRALGIRSCLCYEVSDRDGKDIMEQGIGENVEFIKYTKDKQDSLLKGMFGLHASLTLSNKTMEKCAESICNLDSGFHVHIAEGIEDVYDSLKKYGKRTVQRFMDFNMLGEKTIGVHCVHVNELEMEILKDTDTNVVHNPESNMGNAVGVAPIINMLNKGINLGLGTDGYTTDMFESMKVCNLLQKHNLSDSSVGFSEIPTMVFENNRNISSKYFEKPIGCLKEGAYADLIIVDYNPYTPILKENLNSHILFGMSGGRVDTTIINGKVLMKNRELINIDEESIFNKARELSKKTWERF